MDKNTHRTKTRRGNLRTNAATGRVNLQEGDNLQGRSKQQINSRALKFFRGKARIEGAGRTKGKNTNRVRPADEHERAGKPKTRIKSSHVQ
jgi:hypothetical protein